MSETSEVPNGWRRGHLADIASVNPSVSLSGLDQDSVVTFLSMPDVGENGRIIQRQQRRLKEVRNGFTRFQERDVLFAKITPCMENGKGAWATDLDSGVGFGSTEFHVLRANDDGDPEFIYHVSLFNELRTKAASAFTGSAGQQRVAADFFSRFPVLLPPLPQQRKIAKILTTVDNLIEKTEALIAKYQAIKQGMMHDLFTRGVDPHGHLRPAYDEAPELYKESELGWIPKEWEVRHLADLYASPIRDFGSFSSTNLITFLDNGVPFIKSEMIEEGNVNWTGVMHISGKVHWLLDKSHVHEGEILFSKIGSALGKAVVYDGSRGVCNSNAAVAKITIDRRKAGTFYVAYFLNHDVAQVQFRNMIVSLLPRINLGDINRLLLPVPPVDEQRVIEERLTATDSAMTAEQQRLQKQAALKTGLMQDLLTGKVRVNTDEDAEDV